MANEYTCVGIVSDTHGSLPDEVLEIFSGSYKPEQVITRTFFSKDDHSGESFDEQAPKSAYPQPQACSCIVHAGDIGSQMVLDCLETVAPVQAILGNCDYPGYRTIQREVQQHAAFSIDGVSFGVVHRPKDLRAALRGRGTLQPAYMERPRVAIHGHTHVPDVQQRKDMVLLCPGSASRPREGARPTVMVLYLRDAAPWLVDLVALS